MLRQVCPAKAGSTFNKDTAMLEDYLIRYCAPTLASLKSGSLFNCCCGADDDIEGCISEWNSALSPRGIRMHLLRRTGTTALVYVYRESALRETLSDPEISSFLGRYGYDIHSCCKGCSSECCSVENCLAHLETRISGGDGNTGMSFPHEIGLFLGYPLDDVAGFIKYGGKNCKCTGAWKVYGDASEARKAFARFDKCSNVYDKLWTSGKRSIVQLTVAG